MQDLGFWILNDVIWIKNNPMPNFRGVRFSNAHETLIWAQKKQGAKYTFNHHSMKALNDDLQMRSDWTLPLATGKERLKTNGAKAHSAQKPEALLYRVLMSATNPGDIVLDPFFGSGTTGVMAKKLGRRYIGIEREIKYVQIARRRIDAAMAFDPQALKVQHERAPRIPFGSLLESGFLKPGQKLYLSGNGITATVLANGHIRCKELTGSIHGVAKSLLGSPANGWDVWYYKDDHGNKRVIDELREKVRERLKE
jgi:modification methylase